MLKDGRAQASGIKRPAMDATVLLVVNSHHDVVRFKLPEVTGGTTWRCLLDTNVPEVDEVATFSTGDAYEITGRSLVLYALEPEGKTSIALTRAAAAMRRISEAAAPLPAEAADQVEEGAAEAARTLKTDRETDAPS
jgi:glycogen operon protein